MIAGRDKYQIMETIIKQLDNILNISPNISTDIIEDSIDESIERMTTILKGFSKNAKNAYLDGKNTLNLMNTDQNAMFLYLLSNMSYKNSNDQQIPTGVYYLNKIMHGIDVFYEVELPQYFGFGHCVGTVLGRASYSNYFIITHNCTVGNNKGIYPIFDEHVTMLVGAKVIGNCKIGSNTIIGANAFILDEDVPSNSIVMGSSPNLIIKPNSLDLYRSKWK